MAEFAASSQRARNVLHGLVEAGVRHIVVCPGSRSQALALEAAALAEAGRVTLHVRTDERPAAFVALGIGLETGVPAAVVTTSGSAVANLLPAALEAHHAGVPLLLLTADRPADMRGLRANQTTRQDLLLRPVLRGFSDVSPAASAESLVAEDVDAWSAVAIASGQAAGDDGRFAAGPVQLNLQFREPLSGPAGEPAVAEAPSVELPPPAPTAVAAGPRTLVVAGNGAGEVAEHFARELDAPLIAEVTSGAHFGPNLVVAYRALLRIREFAESVERVIVFGTPTLSREVAALARDAVELIVVDSPGADTFTPVGRTAAVVRAAAVHATGAPSAELAEWRAVWVAASRKTLADQRTDVPVLPNGVALGGHVEGFAAQREYVANELAAIRAAVTRERLVEAVWAATWPNDRLVFGASRLIRVADSVLPGKRVRAFANRGQSGIDGTVSTGLGVAAANPLGVTRVLLGDLAALHDVTALQSAPGEPAPRVQVVVGNDRGGTIFQGLEVAATADPSAFERVQLTPHDVDFAALAQAYGWAYRRAGDAGSLEQALSEPVQGPVLIEVPLER